VTALTAVATTVSTSFTITVRQTSCPADLSRFAETHSRQTSKTAVYHVGDMKGIGTRHNVRNLTTDERTGHNYAKNRR
jgi:hypothetical protein